MNLESAAQQGRSEIHTLTCRRCGNFRITQDACEDIRGDVSFLRAAARQHAERGRPLTITHENWGHLIETHAQTTISENIEKLLSYIARHCERPGNSVPLKKELDYPIIDAKNENEFDWYLQHLQSSGYLRGLGIQYDLTAKGWDHVISPGGSGMIPGRCFVAMSFDEEHAAIFDEGIAPAVQDAGYEPIWMKDVLTNDDICHTMNVEIRKAQFLVADFTGLKGGVYYEAGFARGLGRQVFWTVHADSMKSVHFDTNHYQYVCWKTHEELKTQLSAKIVDLMGYGPHLRIKS